MSTSIERRRRVDFGRDVESLDVSKIDGTPARVAQTKAISAYPTTPNVCYSVSPLAIDGPETEGASAAFTADLSTTLYAYNIGTGVPPIGSKVLVESLRGRYVFRYDA